MFLVGQQLWQKQGSQLSVWLNHASIVLIFHVVDINEDDKCRGSNSDIHDQECEDEGNEGYGFVEST